MSNKKIPQPPEGDCGRFQTDDILDMAMNWNLHFVQLNAAVFRTLRPVDGTKSHVIFIHWL